MQARFSFIYGFAAAATLASCAAPPPPQPEPAAVPAPVVPAPVAAAPAQPSGHWTEWPITPGDWAYRQDGRGSIALFGPAGGDALVTLRCDIQRGRIYLGRASSQRSGQFTLRSSARLKELPARSTGGQRPYMAAEIMPNDPILDAIAYSRGRIALQTSGELSLALPVWSEIGRIVEDCRR